MSVVGGLAARAAVFMVRAGYSLGSRASYQRVWDQFGGELTYFEPDLVLGE